MKVVCAWCGKPMGIKPPHKDKGTTHGICPDCLERYFGKKPPSKPAAGGLTAVVN